MHCIFYIEKMIEVEVGSAQYLQENTFNFTINTVSKIMTFVDASSDTVSVWYESL